MVGNDSSIAQGEPLDVVLVHGTWGRGLLFRRDPDDPRLWFSPRSGFSGELRAIFQSRGFNPEIRSHHWSGANSFKHRDRAAEELASDLQQRLLHEQRHHLLIAHSHGGNILMRAMHYLDGYGVNATDQQRLHVVTIATPFIDLSRRRAGLTDLIILWFVVMAALYAFFKLVYPLTDWMENNFRFLILRGFMGIAFVSFAYLIFGRWIEDESYERSDASPHFLATLSTSHYNMRQLHTRCLVLRGYDDEAALAIALGTIGNRLSTIASTAISLILPLLLLLHLGQYLTGWGGICRDEMISEHIYMEDCSQTFFRRPLYLLTLILYSVVGLAALFKSAYGRELMIGGWFVNAVSNSVPDLRRGFSIKTLTPLGQFGMRHFLHSDPRVAREIARWFRNDPQSRSQSIHQE